MSKRIAAILTVLVLVSCGAVLFVANIGGDKAEAGPAKSTPTPSLPLRTKSVPAPSGGTVKQIVKAAKPGKVTKVSLSDAAELSNSVTVKVLSVRSRTVKAVGPGESTGPAVVAVVEVANRSAKSVSVDSAVVTLSYGKKSNVGLPMTGGSNPFIGSVKPGDTARGTYVFGVPKSGQKTFNILVAYAAGAPVAQFDGGIK